MAAKKKVAKEKLAQKKAAKAKAQEAAIDDELLGGMASDGSEVNEIVFFESISPAQRKRYRRRDLKCQRQSQLARGHLHSFIALRTSFEPRSSHLRHPPPRFLVRHLLLL